MKNYTVWISFQGGYYTTIQANSREEAIDIAYDEADVYEVCGGWDVDVDVEVDED